MSTSTTTPSRQHTLDTLLDSLSTKLKRRRSKNQEPEPGPEPGSDDRSPATGVTETETGTETNTNNDNGNGNEIGAESRAEMSSFPRGVMDGDGVGAGASGQESSGGLGGVDGVDGVNGRQGEEEKEKEKEKDEENAQAVLLKRRRARTSPLGSVRQRQQVDEKHRSLPLYMAEQGSNLGVLFEHTSAGSGAGAGTDGVGVGVEVDGDKNDDGRCSVVDVYEGPGIAAALTRPSGEGSPRRATTNSSGGGSGGGGGGGGSERILKLSPEKIHELTSSPESVPYRMLRPSESDDGQGNNTNNADGEIEARVDRSYTAPAITARGHRDSHAGSGTTRNRPHGSRTVSTPTSSRRQMPPTSNSERLSQTWTTRSKQDRLAGGGRIDIEPRSGHHHHHHNHHNHHLAPSSSSQQPSADALPSPMPQSIPLPPLSVPTYLQLELASERPSPLYIHRSGSSDFPYESSRVKLERLVNFLTLPPALEQVLWFGALACLDSWLYSFTILPLRFLKAVYILLESWAVNVGVEVRDISNFIVKGVGRMWRRRRTTQSGNAPTGAESVSRVRTTSSTSMTVLDRDVKNSTNTRPVEAGRRHRRSETRKPHHRRQRSIPSALLPDDKADILKGLLMIATCSVLMYFDASRMYHWIRGQAAIKLYVIYNVLEVSDRLFAALGQDVLECLFSREALERKPDGRSKVVRPFWLFLLALAYTVLHATALFFQVMTLNVAVNSYSNALITLLLSNQFVEIKSTVFKKFEKENLFQLTCADVVERFQLWLMLLIIALRNIVETGAFDIFGSLGSSLGTSNSSTSTNSTPLSTPPRTATSILPKSFTLFPSSLFSSLSGDGNSFLPTLGQVMGPFLVVLGSEMLVDWLKHAYINKFNNTRPAIYGRFLDVLAKDYYTNAFADQNLTRRLGLPVIPLSCLFFRVSVQTYQMFLASLLPHPPPSSSSFSSSTTTAVEDAHSLSSMHDSHVSGSGPVNLTIKSIIPASADKISSLFRSALANAMPTPARSVQIFTTILVVTGFVALLVLKLLLGMMLLSLARSRYKGMKSRETDYHRHEHQHQNQHHHQHHQHQHHPHQHHPQTQYTLSSPTTTTTTSSPTTTPNTPNSNPNSNHNHNTPTTNTTNTDPSNQTQPPPPRRGYAIDGSRRVGGWGVVEVNDDKRRWIYADDPDALRKLREKEEKEAERNARETSAGGAGVVASMEGVSRYEMVAKRIW